MVIALDIDELVARLQKLGIVDMPKNTLKRWAFTEKVITQPTTPKLKGRGFKSNWHKNAVEEAAAVWAVRNCGVMKPNTLKKKRIEIIRSVAARLDDDEPVAVYSLRPIAGPLSTQHIAPENIKMKFVSEDCDGLDLFPGQNSTEKADCLNELVKTWVVAIEKVRQWEYDAIHAQMMEDPDLLNLAPVEIDYSQIDPWRIEVPCPWRIEDPARVELYWGSRPSKNKNERREFRKAPFMLRRKLSKSDHDEVILFENGTDTREFFKIDVTDSEGWTKAKFEEMEREIRSSTSPLEKMMLEMQQAQLKNWVY